MGAAEGHHVLGAEGNDVDTSGHTEHKRSFAKAALKTRARQDLISTLTDRSFASDAPHHTHEHYLKVVETQVMHRNYQHLDHFTDSHVYRYTASSHEYQEEGNIPKIKFTYDLDPMGVLVQDNATPLYKFITSVCAIIGGAFTIFGLLDGVFYHSMRTLEKKMQLGKAN